MSVHTFNIKKSDIYLDSCQKFFLKNVNRENNFERQDLQI